MKMTYKNKLHKMKKLIGAIGTIVIVLILNSCGPHVKGNGTVTKEKHKIGNKTNIDISGQFIVYIKQGKNSELVIETDENLHEYIDVSLEKNTIKVNTAAYIVESEELNIYLTMPDVDNINLSGAVQLETEGKIKTDYLTIDASGATEIQLNVNVKRLNLEISGASESVLSGKAENVEIEARGACEIEAFKLSAKNMFIDISGAGSADVNAKKILDIEISGAGEIRYKGTPKITQDISGSGSIKEAH